MKQRTIHEQRNQRNHLIAQLEADLALNLELTPRIQKFVSDFKAADDQPAFFSRTVERLKTNPDPAAQAPGQDSYDTIIYNLLLTVYDDVKKKGVEKDSPNMGEALLEALTIHLSKLEADTEVKRAKVDQEKKEKSKKITTEDIHEGFESKVSHLRRDYMHVSLPSYSMSPQSLLLEQSPIPKERGNQRRPPSKFSTHKPRLTKPLHLRGTMMIPIYPSSHQRSSSSLRSDTDASSNLMSTFRPTAMSSLRVHLTLSSSLLLKPSQTISPITQSSVSTRACSSSIVKS
jgi:hypothetical protein